MLFLSPYGVLRIKELWHMLGGCAIGTFDDCHNYSVVVASPAAPIPTAKKKTKKKAKSFVIISKFKPNATPLKPATHGLVNESAKRKGKLTGQPKIPPLFIILTHLLQS